MPSPDTFVAARRADWTRLEALLGRAGAGNLHRLEAEALEELGRPYRRLTADLASAERDFPGERVTRYVNHLLGRAHASVYRSEATGARRLRDFLLVDFPRLFRANWRFILASAALFWLPGVVAY